MQYRLPWVAYKHPLCPSFGIASHISFSYCRGSCLPFKSSEARRRPLASLPSNRRVNFPVGLPVRLCQLSVHLYPADHRRALKVGEDGGKPGAADGRFQFRQERCGRRLQSSCHGLLGVHRLSCAFNVIFLSPRPAGIVTSFLLFSYSGSCTACCSAIGILRVGLCDVVGWRGCVGGLTRGLFFLTLCCS